MFCNIVLNLLKCSLSYPGWKQRKMMNKKYMCCGIHLSFSQFSVVQIILSWLKIITSQDIKTVSFTFVFITYSVHVQYTVGLHERVGLQICTCFCRCTCTRFHDNFSHFFVKCGPSLLLLLLFIITIIYLAIKITNS